MALAPRVAALTLLAAVACGGGGGRGGAAATTTSPSAAPDAAAPSTSAPTSSAPPNLAWQPRTPAPTPRQEVAAAAADGRVWVIGGLTASGATTLVETYDPATDRWAPGPALPVALHHASATTFRGEVVVAGGFLAGDDLYARPSARVIALRGGRWVDLPPLRRPRGAAAAAVAGDRLAIVGGRDSAALIGPTEVFDGTAWRDAAPIPTRRDHLSAVSDGRTLFVAAGRFLSAGAITAAFERYDPAADAWDRLPAVPTARGGQAAALVGGRVVVAGGEDPGRVFPQVEAYDVAAEAWATLAPMPTPRHGFALENVGGQVVALVGGTAFGLAPSPQAEALVRGG